MVTRFGFGFLGLCLGYVLSAVVLPLWMAPTPASLAKLEPAAPAA